MSRGEFLNGDGMGEINTFIEVYVPFLSSLI